MVSRVGQLYENFFEVPLKLISEKLRYKNFENVRETVKITNDKFETYPPR